MKDEAPLALAERIIALFAEGAFSATYKHALLLSLIDLTFEKTGRTGVPPSTLTTREIAEQVLALYWPQCVPWHSGSYLKQGGAGASAQAEILSRIIEFRRSLSDASSQPLVLVRRRAPEAFERLLDFVEWKLIEMPIPRLQVVGGREDRFLYEYSWDTHVRKREVNAYRSGVHSNFDNTLRLLPGVAEGLIRLNGLLRPVIQREWLGLVQQFNGHEESRLEQFLFDRSRESLTSVTRPLLELQDGRCFFCLRAVRARPAVDHFVPWARVPNNAIENLVVAHETCNGDKRDFLAATDHLRRWVLRVEQRRADFQLIADNAPVESLPTRSLGIASATYLSLPTTALLWERGQRLVRVEREQIRRALVAA